MTGLLSSLRSGGRIALHSRTRKLAAVGAAILVSLAYSAYALRGCLAAYYSQKPDIASLQAAARLDPGDAEYANRLGQYYALVAHDFHAALAAYKVAVERNPRVARYWLSLADAYGVLENPDAQQHAIERAIEADPRTPDVAWDAANFYLTRNQAEPALREFRVVMANDPSLLPAALQLSWRVRPDVDALLRDVVPPSAAVHLAFLELLIARKETDAAARVWERLVQLRQPMESPPVFDYIRYLEDQKEVEQARRVWQEAAPLCGLSAYLPSADNLVVNGDFSLDVLNGGFDWLYHKQPDVTLALDPTDFHSGHRSLSLVFDGQGVDDLGIQQLIPVWPNTAYEFSAYFKAKDIQGAGGPRFAIQDAYKHADYFTSDELMDADYWKLVGGSFTTGSETTMLVLHLQRYPPGSPIRGQLWVDNIRLVQKQP